MPAKAKPAAAVIPLAAVTRQQARQRSGASTPANAPDPLRLPTLYDYREAINDASPGQLSSGLAEPPQVLHPSWTHHSGPDLDGTPGRRTETGLAVAVTGRPDLLSPG